MIDMSKLYEHEDYEDALESFNSREDINNCDHTHWSLFKDIHLSISKNRCPICECLLNNTVTRPTNNNPSDTAYTVTATIDHFRPQEYYSFLRCNHKNYLLMCSECNNIYKGNSFPIYDNSERATNESEIENEPHLIVNPITDNLLELFVLVFKQTSSGKCILELKPKEDSGYKHEKALETIKLFGLGDCEINRHSNDNVHNCRISILESHFGVFFNFVKALKEGDKRKSLLELRNNKNKFEKYGFFDFIKNNQFEILVP